MTRAEPVTLMAYMRSQSAMSASSTRSTPNAPPALLTSTSRRPPTASTRPATDSGEVTSHSTAVPPISCAKAVRRSRRRAAQRTWRPSAASLRAVAAPIPLDAPVTTAVFVVLMPSSWHAPRGPVRTDRPLVPVIRVGRPGGRPSCAGLTPVVRPPR